MYLVQVDDGLPEMRLLLVEVAHTNLTEVTGMVLLTLLASKFAGYRPCRESSRGHVEPCPSWCGGGADHRPYHDHRDACGAFLHDRVRQRRGRDCERRSVSPSIAFVEMLNNFSSQHRFQQVAAKCDNPTISNPTCFGRIS